MSNTAHYTLSKEKIRILNMFKSDANPFSESDATPFIESAYFTDIVKSQIESLELYETVKVDLVGKTICKFRMTLRHVQGLKRFKTKTNWNKDLYIMRTR